MWQASCSTGGARSQLLLPEQPAGPSPTSCGQRTGSNTMQEPHTQSYRGRESWALLKHSIWKSVTCVVQQEPGSKLQLGRRYEQSAHTQRRCMPSRKKLGPLCGAAVLTCSRTVIQRLQSCARTMIQCLQGVLDGVQLHWWIAHNIRVWLLAGKGYKRTVEHSEKLSATAGLIKVSLPSDSFKIFLQKSSISSILMELQSKGR